MVSIAHQPVDRGQAIRAAAEWARDNMGVQLERLRKGGVIETGIKSAGIESIGTAIRRGDIQRLDSKRIQARKQP